jgi:hypothetical protein
MGGDLADARLMVALLGPVELGPAGGVFAVALNVHVGDVQRGRVRA